MTRVSETPRTKDLWICDLRTNIHFTLKGSPLSDEYLEDFVAVYKAARHTRIATDGFKRFSYDELVARDKASLDIFWLRVESLEDVENLPPPAVIATEIAEDFEAALTEFSLIAESLGEPNTSRVGPRPSLHSSLRYGDALAGRPPANDAPRP
jgi:type I restriction enzyme M protein